MKRWRLLDTGALPASLNMAIDQALLEMHARGRVAPDASLLPMEPARRFSRLFSEAPLHRYSPPAGKLGIDVVRRPTGGRAVLALKTILPTALLWIPGKVFPAPSMLHIAYSAGASGRVSSPWVRSGVWEETRIDLPGPTSALCVQPSGT